MSDTKKPDLTKISISEYESIFEKDTSEDRKRELIARCYNMTGDEFANSPLPEGAKLQSQFFRSCRELFEEPKNSPSAST